MTHTLTALVVHIFTAVGNPKPRWVSADHCKRRTLARKDVSRLRCKVAHAIMMRPYCLGDCTMIMLFFIAAVVVVIFGLFVWRYEATTGGTGGIVKLLHDRLLLMRLRHREASKGEIESQ